MNLVSIIIPTYNRLDLLCRCVDSIRAYTTEVPYELMVIDNASKDGTAAWCLENKIPFISLPRNEGFPAACNYGLSIAAGDTLLLLHDDTVVTLNWLRNLTTALYSESDIGIVGPVTNYASGSQQVDYPFEDLNEFQRIAAEVNAANPDKWKSVQRIAGICFAFRRGLKDRIGLLDKRFSPGHFEDDDYCHRARLEGYRLLVCHDTLVYHEGSASFRKEGVEKQQQLVERNYRLFKEKWQFDPRV